MKVRCNARCLVGLLVGIGLLYCAFRDVPPEGILVSLMQMRFSGLVLALFLYSVDLSLRSLRWWCLLTNIGAIEKHEVGEALMVGYAFNNLLPARLGELARADYLHQRIGFGRARILGTIVLERLFDGMCVTLMLAAGCILVDRPKTSNGPTDGWSAILHGAAIAAGSFSILALGVIMLPRLAERLSTLFPGAVRHAVLALAASISAFRLTTGIVALNIGIWVSEAAVFRVIAYSVGAHLTVPGTLLLTGAASLSTLIPTAPGYVGSYQYVFAVCMPILGIPAAFGIVAATVIQIFLFGAVTVIGLTIYVKRNITVKGDHVRG